MRVTCLMFLCLGALLTAGLLGGCSPEHHRRGVDERATAIVEGTQRDALGRQEPFTIDQPADLLRRRLLLGQGLPTAGPASLGADYLDEIEHWPEKGFRTTPAEIDPASLPAKDTPLCLTLNEALQVAAANNREYQARKEELYRAALGLDLERDAFANTFTGALDASYSTQLQSGTARQDAASGNSLGWSRRLMNGASFTGLFALDLARLLTLDRASAYGVLGDLSVNVPMLRGSGRHIVTEPLTQAERNVLYAAYAWERYKRTLAVRVASEYLSVLQQLDQVRNAEENYRQLILAGRRAQRLAESGRLPEIQVDQARQDELRARDRWISAQQAYAQRLDGFKGVLGLPTDAVIELEREELERLAETTRQALAHVTTLEPGQASARGPAGAIGSAGPRPGVSAGAAVELDAPTREGGGPYELDPTEAVTIALEHRLDLRTAQGRVFDAQRRVVVAADRLRSDLRLAGGGSAGGRRGLGSGASGDAPFRPDLGFYDAGLVLDPALERSAEAADYRDSYIRLDQVVRSVQELEDSIKLEIRSELRGLLQARESLRIQATAVRLAERRVASTELFLQAGRAEIRDVLEAQEALVNARDALSAALVDYRVAELELQRDMGVLEVDEKGLWHEYLPQ